MTFIRPERSAEDQYRPDHQRDIHHVSERTDLYRREEVVQHDAGTVDAARDDVVGVDEIDESGCQNRTAYENANPRLPPVECPDSLYQRFLMSHITKFLR